MTKREEIKMILKATERRSKQGGGLGLAVHLMMKVVRMKSQDRGRQIKRDWSLRLRSLIRGPKVMEGEAVLLTDVMPAGRRSVLPQHPATTPPTITSHRDVLQRAKARPAGLPRAAPPAAPPAALQRDARLRDGHHLAEDPLAGLLEG